MSSLIGRRVKMLQTHGSLHVQGPNGKLVNVKTTLNSSVINNEPATDMEITDCGVLCNRLGVEFVLPFANIQIITLETQSKPKDEPKLDGAKVIKGK